MFYSIVWRLSIFAMTGDVKPKSESESITFRIERNVLRWEKSGLIFLNGGSKEHLKL